MTTPSPLVLNQIEETGATRFGYAVRRIVLMLEDGREVSIDVPIRNESTFALDPGGSRGEVLAILRSSPVPLSRKAIAGRLGREIKANKGVTGRLAADVRWLLSAGFAFESQGEVTDDVKKFRKTG